MFFAVEIDDELNVTKNTRLGLVHVFLESREDKLTREKEKVHAL